MTRKIQSSARVLRRNSTKAEQLLWGVLRNRKLQNCKFRRQFPIPPYIADFCCFDQKLIIELDGEYHDLTFDKDQSRTQYLEKMGFRIIRFNNQDVMRNLEGVSAQILRYLSK